MSDRARPVIPAPSGGGGRRNRLRIVGIAIGCAAVLVAAVVVILRFLDLGGGASQTALPSETLPPGPVTTTTVTTTTMPPPTTTTPLIVEVVEEDLPPVEAESADEQQSAEMEIGTDGRVTGEGLADPPTEASLVGTIHDAGDFAATMTLACMDYDLRIEWHVSAPYEIPLGAELQRERERTPAPIGSDGALRVYMETFVPADVDPDATEEVPSEEVTPDDGGQPLGETSGGDAPADETIEDPEGEASPEPESFRVLEVTDISGWHTDRQGMGQATARLRHRCPAMSASRSAEWKLTVEGHAEVAWTLTFQPSAGDASRLETSDAGTVGIATTETDDAGVGEVLEDVASQIVSEDSAGSTGQ